MPHMLDTCPRCRAFLEPGTPVCPYCGCELRVRRRGLMKFFWSAPASHALLLAIAVFFGAEIYLEQAAGSSGGAFAGLDSPSLLTLARLGADDYFLNVGEGEWWRFITAMFLHGGLIHLLFNGWVLVDLSRLCEETYGAARLWTVYFLSGVAGNLVSLLWQGSRFQNLGASGAICGLIGLMTVFGLGRRGDAGADAIRRAMVRWLVYIVLFGSLVNLSAGPIRVDNAAHLGGAAAGAGLGLLLGFRAVRRGPRWTRFVWRPAAAAFAAVTLFAFGAMIAGQRKWIAAREILEYEEELPRLVGAVGTFDGREGKDPASRAELERALAALDARRFADPRAEAARGGVLAAGTRALAADGEALKTARDALIDALRAYNTIRLEVLRSYRCRLVASSLQRGP